jgi:hypothetical protein
MVQKPKPAAVGMRRASVTVDDLLTFDGPDNKPNLTSRQVSRAELVGDDVCTACGITARSPSPVLAICRELVAVGIDPAIPLHAYRGDVLCLIVRSISEGARLEVNAKGTGFTRLCAVRAGSPIRKHEVADTRHPNGTRRVGGGGS